MQNQKDLKNQRLNSTSDYDRSSKERSNSIKNGLQNFIRKSNIDVEELSQNLSQKKQNQRNTNSSNSGSHISRSKTNNSKKNEMSTRIGPGLPLPRQSLSRSKKLAEQYRKSSLEFKSNNKSKSKQITPEGTIKLQNANKLHQRQQNLVNLQRSMNSHNTVNSRDEKPLNIIKNNSNDQFSMQVYDSQQQQLNELKIAEQLNEDFNNNEQTFENQNIVHESKNPKYELQNEINQQSDRKYQNLKQSPNFCQQLTIKRSPNNDGYNQNITENQMNFSYRQSQTPVQPASNRNQKIAKIGSIVNIKKQQKQHFSMQSQRNQYQTFGNITKKIQNEELLQQMNFQSNKELLILSPKQIEQKYLNETKSDENINESDQSLLQPNQFPPPQPCKQIKPGMIVRQKSQGISNGSKQRYYSIGSSHSGSSHYYKNRKNLVYKDSSQPKMVYSDQQKYVLFDLSNNAKNNQSQINQNLSQTQISDFHNLSTPAYIPESQKLDQINLIQSNRQSSTFINKINTISLQKQNMISIKYLQKQNDIQSYLNNTELLRDYQQILNCNQNIDKKYQQNSFEPLFRLIWECFKDENLKTTKIQLKNKQKMESLYQQIREEIEERMTTKINNQRFQVPLGIEIFIQSQLNLKSIREATQILYKERLAHEILQLIEIKEKLKERQAQVNIIKKKAEQIHKPQKIGKHGEEFDSDQVEEVHSMKHSLLLDICTILTKKSVLFSLQLNIFVKEELSLVFEQFYNQYYASVYCFSYFQQLKKWTYISKQKKARNELIILNFSILKKNIVFQEWKLLKIHRIQYQKRIIETYDKIRFIRLKNIFYELQIRSKSRILDQVDKQIVKLYYLQKLKLQIFIKWKFGNLNLQKIKSIALYKSKNNSLLFLNESLSEIQEENLQETLQICKDIIFSENGGLSEMLKIRLQLKNKIKQLEQNKKSKKQIKQKEILKIKKEQIEVFPSLLRTQHSNEFFQTILEDKKAALEMKYDIHSLLVDAQNYYQNRLNPQLEFQNYKDLPFQHPKYQVQQFNQNSSQNAAFDSQINNLHAPNQLFRKLEQKIQQKQNQNQIIELEERNNKLVEVIYKIEDEIKIVVLSVKNIYRNGSNQNDTERYLQYQKNNSFAVKYLISRIKNLRFNIPQSSNENTHQGITSQNTSQNYFQKNNSSSNFHIEIQNNEINTSQDQHMKGSDYGNIYEITERQHAEYNQRFIGDGSESRYKQEIAINDTQQYGQEDYDQESDQYIQSTQDRDFYVDQFNMQQREIQNESMVSQAQMNISNSDMQILANPTNANTSSCQDLKIGTHAPSFSVISKISYNKDKYTLEDYVQMALSFQQQIPAQFHRIIQSMSNQSSQKESNQILSKEIQIQENQDNESESSDDNDLHSASSQQRQIFIFLNIAKSVGRFYKMWRENYLHKRLLNLADTLSKLKQHTPGYFENIRSLNLMKKTFSKLKNSQNLIEKKAIEYDKIRILSKNYLLFKRWRDSQFNIKQEEIQKIKKWRKRRILQAWYISMSEYFLMKFKASKYQQQALTSKALLSLYQYAIQKQQVREFRKNLIFKKYFKNQWYRQYKRNKLMKNLIKKLGKMETEWERTKYQREYNNMMDSFKLWKSKAEEKRELVRYYNALNHYRGTLLIKHFNFWKKLLNVKKGAFILHNIMFTQNYMFSLQKIKNYTVKTQLLQRDWKLHRQIYMKQQIIIRWRENVVKTKLAYLFFKKKIFQGFKNYVFKKNREIPFHFFSKYRQILFFKILCYFTQKRKKANKKLKGINKKVNEQYQMLKKKCFLSLLENVFKTRKERIIKRTIKDFRTHQSFKKVFKTLKLEWLLGIKDKIQDKVAEEFREEKLKQNKSYVCPPIRIQIIESEMTESSRLTWRKMLLQKVYTSWLQFTLDMFVKKKVLKRFLLYQNQKLIIKTFKLLKCLKKSKVNSQIKNNYKQVKRNLSCSSGFNDKNSVKSNENIGKLQHKILQNKVIDNKKASQDNKQRKLQKQDSGKINYQLNIKKQEKNKIQTSSKSLQNDNLTSQKYEESTFRNKNKDISSTPFSGYVESSIADYTPDNNQYLLTQNQDFINQTQIIVNGENYQTFNANQNEDTTIHLPQQKSEEDDFAENQKLFAELDVIFKKNQKWMEDQRHNQMNILKQMQNTDVSQSQHIIRNYQQQQISKNQNQCNIYSHPYLEDNQMEDNKNIQMKDSQISLISSTSSQLQYKHQIIKNIENQVYNGQIENNEQTIETSSSRGSGIQVFDLQSSIQTGFQNSMQLQFQENLKNQLLASEQSSAQNASQNQLSSQRIDQNKYFFDHAQINVQRKSFQNHRQMNDECENNQKNNSGSFLLGGLVLSSSGNLNSNDQQSYDEGLIYSNQTSNYMQLAIQSGPKIILQKSGKNFQNQWATQQSSLRSNRKISNEPRIFSQQESQR